MSTKNLSDLEEILAHERPFGDWRYIDERSWIHYGKRVELLCDHLEVARPFRDALADSSDDAHYCVLGDPVVRSTIDRALSHFRLRKQHALLKDVESVLRIATNQLTQGVRIAPLQVGAEPDIGINPYQGWIWEESCQKDIFERCFRRLFLEQEGDRAILCSPDKTTLCMLHDGTRLLSTLIPSLARSALNHVHVVRVVDTPQGSKEPNQIDRLPFQAFTTARIPGTVFLSISILEDPCAVAEALLHEALHLKWYDLRHTHSMLRSGYHERHASRICATWNKTTSDDSNMWPVCRAVAAFHVYVHLAFFFQVIEQHGDKWSEQHGLSSYKDPTIAARSCLDRAYYLGHELQLCMSELGWAGQRFVEWLLSVLVTLDPNRLSHTSTAAELRG